MSVSTPTRRRPNRPKPDHAVTPQTGFGPVENPQIDELEIEAYEDETEHELEQQRLKQARGQARRKARELGIDPRLAVRAALLDPPVPLKLLVGVEFLKGNPIFKEPPALDDPLRRLIDLKLLSEGDLKRWLEAQAKVPIVIPRDANEDEKDPTGVTNFWLEYVWNGVKGIWVLKGLEPWPVPWPIAEDWKGNHPLRVRAAQYTEQERPGQWRPGDRIQ